MARIDITPMVSGIFLMIYIRIGRKDYRERSRGFPEYFAERCRRKPERTEHTAPREREEMEIGELAAPDII